MKQIVLSLLLSLTALNIIADELDDQIEKLSKEIKNISNEIDNVKSEEEKDLSKFHKYEERTKTFENSIKKESDSLRLQISKLAITNDSLNSLIYSVENKINNYNLKDKDLRKNLIKSCNELSTSSNLLPPSIALPLSNTIQFLQNELNQNSISTLEGIHRFGKIVSQIQDYEMSIQVSQGTSPVKEINGQVHILRIGTCFEAIVDNDAKICALWNKNTEGNWEIIERSDIAQDILNAVRIHEGKSIPALANIPFNITKGE